MKNTLLRKLDITALLVLTVPIFGATMYYLRYSPYLQFQTLIIASFIYILVALTHHYHTKTLKLELVIEYILIAGLALVILQSLLF